MGQAVVGAGGQGEGRAGTINFLADLAGGLTVGVKVFQRDRQRAVNVAVADVSRQRLFGQVRRIIMPGTIQGVLDVFGQQQARESGRSSPASARCSWNPARDS